MLILVILLLFGCEKPGLHPNEDNLPPTARLTISPFIADSTTPFALSASRSTDQEDINLLMVYRWDLNGDSIWDTEYSSYPKRVERFRTPGWHFIAVEVKDRYGLVDIAWDSLFTYGRNTDTSHLVDPRDGQFYRTVMLDGIWWMAENLNIGTMILDTVVPTDNGIIEKFSYLNDPSILGEVGGYYTYYDWPEMMNYDTVSVYGICPPGWEIPSFDDWQRLKSNHFGNAYFAEWGLSNLNLSLIGYHTLTKEWEAIDRYLRTSYWMYFTRSFENDFYNQGANNPCPFVESSKMFNDHFHTMRWVSDSVKKYRAALPVRCIKRD